MLPNGSGISSSAKTALVHFIPCRRAEFFRKETNVNIEYGFPMDRLNILITLRRSDAMAERMRYTDSVSTIGLPYFNDTSTPFQ